MAGTNATLNQLIETFNLIATHHGQINAFFQGHPSDFTAVTVKQYPLLAVEILPATFESINITFNFRVFMMDLVDKDKNNELGVQSDMIRILNDIIQWLSSENVYDLDITYDTATPFDEYLDDFVAGWYIDIGIITPQEASYCAVPQKA